MGHYVLGMTGASGIILAKRALFKLTEMEHHISMVMTKDASATATVELPEAASPEKLVATLPPEKQSLCTIYRHNDFFSPIASGSSPVDGMIVIPCSMSTLAAIAAGLSDNLLRRAADVTLKERRNLVIVPRETPLSEIHLRNMLTLTQAGAVIVPPVPGWYTLHKTLGEMEDFIVGRALDSLGLKSEYPRWEGCPNSLKVH